MGISRRGPCPCGSGKKYKNCCEKKSESNKKSSNLEKMNYKQYYDYIMKYTGVPKLNFAEYFAIFKNSKFHESPEFDKEDPFILENPEKNIYIGFSSEMEHYYENDLPLHRYTDCGSKITMLYLLETLIIAIDKKNDEEIKETCKEISGTFADRESGYLNFYSKCYPSQSINLLSLYNSSPNLMASEAEYVVILQTCFEILLDYKFQDSNKAIDYGAKRVFAELAHKVISSNTIRKKFLSSIVIYVEADRIKSWEAEYSNKMFNYGPMMPYKVSWLPINGSEQEHEYNILRIDMPELDESSANELAYNQYILNKKKCRKNDKGYFSYNSLAATYFGVVEHELNSIISLEYKGQSKKIMWKGLVDFTSNNKIPVLSDKFDVSAILENMRSTRNKVAHGGIMTEEEFDKIYSILFDKKFIEYLALAKRKIKSTK